MSKDTLLDEIQEFLSANKPVDRTMVRDLYQLASKYLMLYQVGKIVLSETHIVALFKLALDKVIQVTKAQRGFLALVDESGQLDFRAARKIDKNDIQQPQFQVSRSIINKVLESYQTIYLANALEHEQFKASKSVSRLRLLSVLCTPITIDGNLVGIIYVDNQNFAHVFDESTKALIQEFSTLMSIALRNAFAYRHLQDSKDLIAQKLRESYKFDHIIGSSPAMVKVLKLVSDVADTNANVLINGEHGTGKELIAKALHYNSNRLDQNFVTVNCAALPSTLIESELFGHVKGAFTGAQAGKKGKFALANKGTILLDEIGELSTELQSKLLRVVEYGTYFPLGSEKEEQCDVRILAATNRDLDAMIQKKQFLPDLYFRLNVIRIVMPPLRQRYDDIEPLTHFFINKHKRTDKPLKISPAALHLLEDYDYPGNVRQLENIIHRAVILCKSDQIDVEHLSEDILAPFSESLHSCERELTFQQKKQHVIEKFEKVELYRLLSETNGKLRRAARLAGMDPKNFSEKLKRYNISTDDF